MSPGSYVQSLIENHLAEVGSPCSAEDLADFLYDRAREEIVAVNYDRCREICFFIVDGLARTHLSAESDIVLSTLIVLAEVQRETGRLKDASGINTHLIDVYMRTLGPQHRTTGLVLNNQAMVLLTEGRHLQALQLLEKVLGIELGQDEPDHNAIAATHNNIGTAYSKLGKHAEAIRSLDAAYALWREHLGARHIHLSSCLLTRAASALALGFRGEAEGQAQEAHDIAREHHGAAHPLTIQARALLRRVRMDRERHRDNPASGESREDELLSSQLAELAQAAQQHGVAHPAYLEAGTHLLTTMLRTRHGECALVAAYLLDIVDRMQIHTDDKAREILRLAAIAEALVGDRKLAAKHFERLHAYASAVSGPGGASWHGAHGVLHAMCGSFVRAAELLLLEVEQVTRETLLQVLVTRHGIGRYQFISGSARPLHMAICAYLRGKPSAELCRRLWEQVVTRETIERESIVLQNPRQLKRRYSGNHELFDQLQNAEDALYKAALMTPWVSDYLELVRIPMDARDAWAGKDRLLVEIASRFTLPELREAAVSGLTDMLNRSPRDAVYIHFLLVEQLPLDGQSLLWAARLVSPGVLDQARSRKHMCAFRARWQDDQWQVELFDLGTQDDLGLETASMLPHIEGIYAMEAPGEVTEEGALPENFDPLSREMNIDLIRRRVRKVDDVKRRYAASLKADALKRHPDFHTLRRSLYEKLLAPVLGHERPRLLRIHADAWLHGLAFEALESSDGVPLIEHAQVSHFIAPRLARGTASATSQAIVFSAPDYDLADAGRELSDGAIIHMGMKCADGQPVSQIARFPELVGAAQEGERISKFLDARHLSGDAATKKEALQVSSPSVLHFATHGYVFGHEEGALKTIGILPPGLDERHERQGIPFGAISDPYLRAGLALAGANWRAAFFQPAPEAMDGVLTARDVLGLDLSGTDLVVLSACETAVGEEANGQALVGLTEAFLMAGAKCVVSSLWKVSDEETLYLMTELYERLKLGDTVGHALHVGKQTLRRKFPEEPYYWASFQCHGDAEVRPALPPPARGAHP